MHKGKTLFYITVEKPYSAVEGTVYFVFAT